MHIPKLIEKSNETAGTSKPPFDRKRFLSLLAMYALGVAIGCLLVGMLLSAKRQFITPQMGTPKAEPAPAGTSSPSTP